MAIDGAIGIEEIEKRRRYRVRESKMGVNVEKEQVANAMSTTDSDIRSFEPSTSGRNASGAGVEAERNTIFDNLVKVEGEVSGLIAYSIYKQNKRSWLTDFQKIVGRPPTEAETRAYIIGESTERRLATYRHLAQSTIAGEGPGRGAGAGALSARSYLVWAVVLIAAVAVLGFALHSGLSLSSPK
jgi:hypothetical protein